jgi:hypothetical protein
MPRIKFSPNNDLTKHLYTVSKRKELETKYLNKYIPVLNWKLITYPGCPNFLMPPGKEGYAIHWVPFHLSDPLPGTDVVEIQIPFGTISHVRDFLKYKRRTQEEHEDYLKLNKMFTKSMY